MPIWLRKFTFKEIKDFYEDENKEYEKAKSGDNSSTLVDSTGKVNPANFPQFSQGSKPRTSYK